MAADHPSRVVTSQNFGGPRSGKRRRMLDAAYAAAALGDRVLIVTPHLKITLHGPPIGTDLPVRRALPAPEDPCCSSSKIPT